MRPTLTMLFVTAAASTLASFPSPGIASEKGAIEAKPAMVPIRRLGLLPVAHNVVDARKNLIDQAQLRGVLAQPLTKEDLTQKLNAILKSVADASGRFWTLDTIATEHATGQDAEAGMRSEFRRSQLVGEYDLDGWLSAEMFFTADHTALRLMISGSQLKPTIAREDVLLPFGANWDAVANGFAQGIGRLSETIGHDGRVVFENGDLFGVDLGVERGLTKGQHLKAGLVLQDALHPQTGEVLRYRRHPLFDLEVVDAQQGAALCRKVALDPDLLRHAEATYGSGTDRRLRLLVWRDASSTDSQLSVARSSWSSSQDAVPRADSASSGFKASESLSQNAGMTALSRSVAPPVQTPPSPTRESAAGTPTDVALVGSNTMPLSIARRDAQTNAFAAVKIAAGLSNGTLELSKGPVNSELPGYLLNTLSVQDGFRYAGEWDVRYGAEYAKFSGPLNGSRFSFRGSGLAPSSALQIPDFPLSWGAEAQYNSGTVRTEKSKKDLDAFELFGVVSTERKLQGGWGLGVEYKQSMTGLLAGVFGFETAIDVQPALPVPKGWGVQWRFINDGDRWTEWLLGVTWKLGVVEE